MLLHLVHCNVVFEYPKCGKDEYRIEDSRYLYDGMYYKMHCSACHYRHDERCSTFNLESK